MEDKIRTIENEVRKLIEQGKDDKTKTEIIFRLSKLLREYKSEYKIANLDSEIESENIIQSLGNRKNKFFRKVDYQYNFLVYIIKEYSDNKELNEYIHGFITEFAEELTEADIVITKTGATRCKTNIRFAVNDLRKLGLIGSTDKQGRRTLRPTLMGLLLVYYLLFNDFHHFKAAEDRLNKTPKRLKVVNNSLTTKGEHRYRSDIIYDMDLLSGLGQLKMIENQYKLLNKFNNIFKNKLDEKTYERFRVLYDNYINYILKDIEFTDDGIFFKSKSESKIGTGALNLINKYEKEIDFDKIFWEMLEFIRKELNLESIF